MAARSSNVHTDEAHNAANAGADEQHGHEQARCYGAARRPDSAQEVDHQHSHQGCVAKLPVGAPGQQVLDGVLPCKSPMLQAWQRKRLGRRSGLAKEEAWQWKTLGRGRDLARRRSLVISSNNR